MNVEKIIEILIGWDIPVIFGNFTEQVKGTELTFFKLKEKPIFFDDDGFEYTESIFQFDLWGLEEDPLPYVQKLRTVLRENGFRFVELEQLHEKQANAVHIAIRFSYEGLAEH